MKESLQSLEMESVSIDRGHFLLPWMDTGEATVCEPRNNP